MSIEEGADAIVGQCLGLRKGECVLIITDTEKRTIGEAIFQAVEKVEALPMLTMIPPPKELSKEPPQSLARFMIECDAVIMATSLSMTHTRARIRASKAGARVVSLPGITEEMLSKGSIMTDYKEMGRMLRILGRKLKSARKIHLTSGSGGDATFDVKGRDWILKDTGLAIHKGEVTTLPAGEIFISPIEGTAEGRLVFDVRLFNLLEQTASIILKDGYATRVTGAKDAVLEMNKGGKDGRNFAKFGIGLNPQARPKADIIEAQKSLGAVHTVFGGSSAFGGKIECEVKVDGIMTDATVEVDGKTILEKGKLLI